MALYVGFYTVDEGFAAQGSENARSGDTSFDPAFLDKVQGLTGAVPEGTTVVASFATVSNSQPNVMIVEANDPSGLNFINTYYGGYLQFDWAPANSVGANQADRDAWRESVN